MKIVSKFTDYYDGLRRGDLDPEPLYVRATSEPMRLRRSLYLYAYTRMEVEGAGQLDTYYRDSAIIGFCGKLYPVIRFYKIDPNNGREMDLIGCFSLEDVKKFYRRRSIAKVHELPKDGRWGMWGALQIKQWFSINERDSVLEDLFVEHRVPAFVVEDAPQGLMLTLNPVLGDYGFYRLFDPQSAYQEIDMFLGGVIAGLDADTVAISDEDMAVEKGFNKWSFRKPPGEKKRRKVRK